MYLQDAPEELTILQDTWPVNDPDPGEINPLTELDLAPMHEPEPVPAPTPALAPVPTPVPTTAWPLRTH